MQSSLSIRSANLLYLVTMILVLAVGSALQTLNLGVGLIVTEIFFILLPTILSFRYRRIPLKDGLSLKRIGILTALICVLLGFSAFLFSIFIEAIMAALTGMKPVPVSANMLPSSTFDSILYFIALAISAPICEEILFRGAIQSAYLSQRTVRFAITITAFLFAFYHFRLTGLAGLIPLAFILGYVAWLTRSIIASMLVHFAVNASSALNTLVAIRNHTGLKVVSPWFALAGVVLAIGLILILRYQYRNLPKAILAPSLLPDSNAHRKTWIINYWPLLVGGLLYLGVAGFTPAASFSPASRASSNYQFFKQDAYKVVASKYQIANKAGQHVGEMTCLFKPDGSSPHLECLSTVQGFELKLGNSYFKDIDHTAQWSATWEADTMDLLDYSYTRENSDGSGFTAKLVNGQLFLDSSEGTESLAINAKSFLEYEWPWRADFLLTNSGDVWKIPFGSLSTWDAEQQKSIPMLTNKLLSVSDDEQLSLPAGDFTARKFSLGNQFAWYAREDVGFPRPVQLDDGMLFYKLSQ